MNNRELYRISKLAYQEAFFDGQMSAMGANKSRFMEKINKDNNFMRNQSVFLKIASALYAGLMGLIPGLIFWISSGEILNESNPTWIVFSAALFLSIFFLIQVWAVLIFGMLFSSGLMSGEVFRWLSTLPLTKEEVSRVNIFAYFRGIDMQFVALTIPFPMITFLSTGNIILTLLSSAIAFSNAIFTLSLLIIIGKKMHNILEGDTNVNSLKPTLIRIISMLSYAIATFSFIILANSVFSLLPTLFQSAPFLSGEMTQIMSLLLSLIPFPFAGAFLIMGVNNISIVSPIVLGGSIIGILLSFLITYVLYKKAIWNLRNNAFLDSTKTPDSQKKTTTDDIKLKIVSPATAFMKRDLLMASRDLQFMMYLLIPFILPLMGLVSRFQEMPESYSPIMITLGCIYIGMGPIVLMFGLSSLEKSGASITASLPIAVRNEVSAKIRFFVVLLPLTLLIPIVFALFGITTPVIIDS
ncbi:MAG: hypothetical protein ACFFBD_11930, partial [Candidatus Hodarchaeota archaeon]